MPSKAQRHRRADRGRSLCLASVAVMQYRIEPLERRALLSSTSGLIFVLNGGSDSVSEYSETGVLINVTLISGLRNPSSIAVSGSDLFIVNSGTSASKEDGSIAEYTTAGAIVNSSLISGLAQPYFITASGSDLFVSSGALGSGAIGEYTTSGATVNAALISGMDAPYGIAISGQNLFVPDWNLNGISTIGEYNTSGATLDPSLLTGLNSPDAIAMSGSDLFVPSWFGGTVGEYTTGGATVNTTLLSGLSGPVAIAESGSNLFVLNWYTQTIGEYSDSGAVLDASLVSGLGYDPLGICVVAPIVVNTLGDQTIPNNDQTDLRDAITEAESESGEQVITFASGLTGTINLASQLPSLSSNITIQGPSNESITVNGGGNGGVFTVNSGATTEIENLTITGGNASQSGGGIENLGTLTIADCTITGNIATQGGGGIDNQGTLTVVNCTITANSAGVGGGISDNGPATVTDCTIVENSQNLAGGGGIYFSTSAQGSAINGTIVAENTGGDIAGGNNVPGSYNLVGDGSGSSSMTNSIIGSEDAPVNPFLGILSNNGGPTKTMLPLAGSRAIGEGFNFPFTDPNGNAITTYDQRGVVRRAMTDIGAVQGTAPSVLALANLSNDVYSASPLGYAGTQGYPAFSYLNISGGTVSNNAAYQANAYISGDETQVVIAFRGTVVSLLHPIETFKSLIAADSSFGSMYPSVTLITEIKAAVAFVASVHAVYPNANITLTGHSLGGGVAQLIGAASGFSTVVFNAPGGQQLLQPLATQLAPVANLGPGGVNINYRIYDDQVSQFGTQFFGSAVTIAFPTGTAFSSQFSYVLFAGLSAVADLLTYLNLHYITTVISQIQADAPQVSNDGERNLTAALENFIEPSSSIIPSVGQVLDVIVVVATSGVAAIIDPSAGADYVLTGKAGSPDIASVELPNLTGVGTYKIRSDTNGTWSAYQEIQPATLFSFGPGVEGLEFQPLGSGGQSVTVNDSFIFAATFASTGTFTGTLVQSDSTSNIAVWTGQGDGISWNGPGNWSDDLVPTESDDAYIGSGEGTIKVPAGTFAANTLTSESPVEIESGASLTLYGVSTIDDGGSLTIDSGGYVKVATSASSNDPGPLVVTSLSVAGTLDLGSSALDVQGGSLAAITSEIASGYRGGTWTGSGIISSAAQADSTHLTTLGVILNNDGNGNPLYGSGTALGLFDGFSAAVGNVLVKYTYYGDTNLDGQVDGSDYTRIDNGFNNHLTGWANGDFDYNGAIDGSDYTLIDNSFNTQGASLAAEPAEVVATPAGDIKAWPKEPTFMAVHSGTTYVAPAFSQAQAHLTFGQSAVPTMEMILLRKDVLDALALSACV